MFYTHLSALRRRATGATRPCHIDKRCGSRISSPRIARRAGDHHDRLWLRDMFFLFVRVLELHRELWMLVYRRCARQHAQRVAPLSSDSTRAAGDVFACHQASHRRTQRDAGVTVNGQVALEPVQLLSFLHGKARVQVPHPDPYSSYHAGTSPQRSTLAIATPRCRSACRAPGNFFVLFFVLFMPLLASLHVPGRV